MVLRTLGRLLDYSHPKHAILLRTTRFTTFGEFLHRIRVGAKRQAHCNNCVYSNAWLENCIALRPAKGIPGRFLAENLSRNFTLAPSEGLRQRDAFCKSVKKQ